MVNQNSKWMAVLAAGALALAACGGDDNNENNTSNGPNNESNMTNNDSNQTNNDSNQTNNESNQTNNESNQTNNMTNNMTNNPPMEVARVQVIHNAADPGAASVDVYANGEILLDDFAFRTASPFVDVPAGVDIEIAVAGGDSASVDDAIATFGPYNLPADSVNVIVANGVLDPTAFEANPEAIDIAFGLWPIVGQEEAADATKFEFQVVHGATDAPTVDVTVQGADLTLVDDAAYGDATGYIAVDPAAYGLDLTLADGTTVVASYDLDTSGFAGVAAVVLASGFLSTGDPDPDENGFELVYYTPDGGAATAIPTQ